MKAIVFAVAAALSLTAGVAAADEALAKKSACMSCHQMAKKVVGPSFTDIAKKYKGDAKAEERFVTVIKKGGKGTWGAVPMPPQALPEADAKLVAQWLADGAKK